MAILVRVVEIGGFSGAARVLGLAPSSVSRLVSRLKQRLGVPLLHRSPRRLALTPEGEAFHARARAILADMEAAEVKLAQQRFLPAGCVSTLVLST